LALVQQPACDHRFHASHSLAVLCISSPPICSCSYFYFSLFLFLSLFLSCISNPLLLFLHPFSLLLFPPPPAFPLLSCSSSFFASSCWSTLGAELVTKLSKFADHISGDCSNLFRQPHQNHPANLSAMRLYRVMLITECTAVAAWILSMTLCEAPCCKSLVVVLWHQSAGMHQ